MRIGARLRQFWHCLLHLHRGERAHQRGELVYLGCECGRVFYGKVPQWWEL